VLDRPPPRPPPRRPPARSSRRSAAQRAYRARQRAGRIVAPVEVGADVVDLLVRLGWLAEHEADDKVAIGKAIAAMLAATR